MNRIKRLIHFTLVTVGIFGVITGYLAIIWVASEAFGALGLITTILLPFSAILAHQLITENRP